MSVRIILKYSLLGIYYLVVTFIIPYVALLFGTVLIDWGDRNLYSRGGFYGIFATLTGQIALLAQIIIWWSSLVLFLKKRIHAKDDSPKNPGIIVLKYTGIFIIIIIIILSIVVYTIARIDNNL